MYEINKIIDRYRELNIEIKDIEEPDFSISYIKYDEDKDEVYFIVTNKN